MGAERRKRCHAEVPRSAKTLAENEARKGRRARTGEFTIFGNWQVRTLRTDGDTMGDLQKRNDKKPNQSRGTFLNNCSCCSTLISISILHVYFRSMFHYRGLSIIKASALKIRSCSELGSLRLLTQDYLARSASEKCCVYFLCFFHL